MSVALGKDVCYQRGRGMGGGGGKRGLWFGCVDMYSPYGDKLTEVGRVVVLGVPQSDLYMISARGDGRRLSVVLL